MKKKIAIISSIYALTPWSGLGRHTFYLAYALAQRNYDVTVFTYAPGGRSFRSQDGQVSITRIGIASSKGNSLPIESIEEWNAKILVELKKQDFEVVLLPTCHGWMSAKEYAHRTISFVPFVYGITGWTSGVGIEVEKKILNIEKEFLTQSDTLICHNEFFASKVAQHANKQVYVLPNCHLALAEDKILPTKKTPNSILCVGKINREKSVETILRALANVPEATLTLCYPENSVHFIPKLVKLAVQLNMSDRLICKGWLPANDLMRQYAQHELTITPSFHESYGYTVLDPMAFGSIPLVGDWTGLAEYVSKEEIFSSVQTLAASMKTTLAKSDVEKQNMLEANYNKIRTTYSENVCTDILEQILRGEI